MTRRHLMIVMSNAVAGRETEYNDWYTNVHLRDVLKIPGFVAAQRYKLGDAQRVGALASQWQYMAVYEMETDDPAISLAEITLRARGPEMPVSDAIGDTWSYVYEPITPRVKCA